MQNRGRTRLAWSLYAGMCLLSLVSSVSVVYGDCTVGGTTFKLTQGSSRTYFVRCTGLAPVTDKYGARYSSEMCGGNGEEIKGISVETNMKTVTQSFPNAYKPGEYPLPITDLYRQAENTTVADIFYATQSEYSLRYLKDGDLLYEFKGTLAPRYDNQGVHIEPFKGTYKTACGEVWTIRQERNGADYPVIKTESPEVRGSKQKENAAARKEGQAEANKLAAFRKKVKEGSNVRVFTGNFQARGLVTEAKKDLVKVQFTEQVIQFQWANIRPFEQWVKRSNLLPPQGGASLY